MFEVGKVYRRRDLHHEFGGSWQSGISSSKTHDIIFRFSGAVGEQYGYSDGWRADGSFYYSGEGQTGDMVFQRGNKAIRDHIQNGKALHLFEKAGEGNVRYRGEMEYDGHEIVERVSDRDGRLRSAIVFRLIPVDRSVGGVAS